MGWRSEGQVSRAGHLEFGILGGGLRKTEEMNKDSTFGTVQARVAAPAIHL